MRVAAHSTLSSLSIWTCFGDSNRNCSTRRATRSSGGSDQYRDTIQIALYHRSDPPTSNPELKFLLNFILSSEVRRRNMESFDTYQTPLSRWARTVTVDESLLTNFQPICKQRNGSSVLFRG